MRERGGVVGLRVVATTQWSQREGKTRGEAPAGAGAGGREGWGGLHAGGRVARQRVVATTQWLQREGKTRGEAPAGAGAGGEEQRGRGRPRERSARSAAPAFFFYPPPCIHCVVAGSSPGEAPTLLVAGVARFRPPAGRPPLVPFRCPSLRGPGKRMCRVRRMAPRSEARCICMPESRWKAVAPPR